MNWTEKIFGTTGLKPDQIVGPIPATKDIVKRTITIAWPSATEAVLISLIGAVDMMMVGQLGAGAIASVGITNQPKFILFSVIIALNIGLTVIVSRRKGQKDAASANQLVRNAIVISTMISAFFNTLGFIYAPQILKFSGASADYIDTSVIYFRIVLIGMFFFSIGSTITAAQRGAGNTKISMKTNISANVVNVIFNFLLINGIWIFPQWGVMGAAVATMIGNVVAFIIAIRSASAKDGFLSLSFKQDWRLHKASILSLINISKSALVEQIFLRIGFFTYILAIAGLGTIAFATHQVVMNVMMISFAVGDGLSIACSSLVGQSLGAKRPDLAIIYGKTSQRIGLLVAIGLGLFIAIFRVEIISLFNKDPQIVSGGSTIMLILAVIMLFQIAQVITIGSLRGAGDVKFVAYISLISVTIVRPLLTYLFAYPLGMGLMGAWLSVLLDQSLRYAIGRWRFAQAKWTRIEV
jgi:putative MATE family efflux protein